MADLFYLKGTQFFDSNGDPLNGGKLRFFDAGTTDERTVYKDAAAAVPWAQPIELDSAGRLTASVYIPEGAFKITLHSAADVQVFSEDDIPGAAAAASTAFARPQRPILTKAAGYTLTLDDLGRLVEADGSGGAFTLTLPSAADVASGKGYDIQQVGTVGAVTIATVSAQTINGAATFVLRPQYGVVRITSDGANWYAEPFEIQRASPAAKTSAYTVKQADEGRLIPCDATSAGLTVTLPTVALAGNGFRIGIKKIDASANAVTVDGDSAETIDGAADFALNAQFETVWLICDGAAWHVWNFYSTIATAADWRTGTHASKRLGVANTWAAAAEVTLTDAATIAVDLASGINFVVTLGDNRTLGNPTNEKPGQSGYIRIVQDGAGSRTLAYGSDWEFAGGNAPVLSTAVNAQDLLFYQVIAADRVFASLVKAIG